MMGGNQDPSLKIGLLILFSLAMIAAIGGGVYFFQASLANQPQGLLIFQYPTNTEAPLTWWWDDIPEDIRQASVTSPSESNIHREDYAGPESCQKCHPKNYQAWSEHPHKRMNQIADESTVVGDFSNQTISYMGGTAAFFQSGKHYLMRMIRGNVEMEFVVTQTIGSRFFQYYVGKMLRGPYRKEDVVNRFDHVLPFGYWLDRKEWVPVVHVGNLDDKPDSTRTNPFDAAEYPFPPYFACNTCHTTFPLADTFSRAADKLARHLPNKMHWDVSAYLASSHMGMMSKGPIPELYSEPEARAMVDQTKMLDARNHAVTLGISCEACHLGARKHAEGKQDRPEFFPKSPLLYVEAERSQIEPGRSHSNVNWACARCHAGERPQLAASMATWNSTEFTDAARGSCYSQLRCIDCHDPHQAIGPKWTAPPEEDDANCLKCHGKFSSPVARRQHTHHAPGSEGDRCMNCHMPRINEGLQDMVRTHMIFSPTNPEMIESNQPNACNMCHTKENISWTLGHLKDWYGAEYSEDKIARAYRPNTGQDGHDGHDGQDSKAKTSDVAVAVGWLKSHHEAVRLIGADSLIRRMIRDKDRWALPEVLRMLDDPFLINRQFTMTSIERLLSENVTQRYGYRFYMSPEERREPLARMRQVHLKGAEDADRVKQAK